MLEVPAADGVAGFVVGDYPLFLWVEDEGLFLEAADDTLDGLLEVDHLDGVGVGAGSYIALAEVN